jgi:NAD(P)H-hydrate epimerase
MALPVALYSTAQIRALDAHAIESLGVSGYTLMKRAGEAALRYLRTRWPMAHRIVIVCGNGNNGGDGYVLARLARDARWHVHVIALEPPRAGSDAEHACSDWVATGGSVLDADAALPPAEVVVDAIFGTGLARAPEGVARRWIEAINSSGRPVLALDVPSGVNSDSGEVPGVAVRADATASFVAHKRGLFTGAARDHCGQVGLDALGVPQSVFAATPPDALLLDAATIRQWLPPRLDNAHKGNFGHVLAIGGDAGMGGAIRLAGEAALRAGAGLVSVATRAAHVTALNAARPELMAAGVEGPQELDALLQRASVVAVGPGLGQRAWGHALWHAALGAGKPQVLDADALNLLARDRSAVRGDAILTPHPGEAARLLDIDTAAIAKDRFAAARAIAQRYSAVTVLKGAGTLIASPGGELAVCPWGNPGMASGGMGDVLTGVIAGLLAQGLSTWQAACGGVALHALAGDAAAHAGQAGMVAGDLFTPLRKLRNGLPAT